MKNIISVESEMRKLFTLKSQIEERGARNNKTDECAKVI